MNKIKLNKYTRYFLQGKLSTENERELLNWINRNAENRNLFFKEQASVNEYVISQKDAETNKRWEALKLRISPKVKKQKSRTLFLRVASVAAAFIIGVVGTVAIVKNYGLFENKYAQIQNISVPHGAKTNIELPDGSMVWLNSGTTLSYSSEFEKNRPVALNGEAFFEVQKSDKPFIVSTNYGDVEVKGTTFNVKAYSNEPLQATLVTGSVLVSDKASEKGALLQPGQQANVVNNQINVSNVETDLFTSWKDGKLIFRKEYLPTAAKRIERWYNVKIELDDDKRLNDIMYSGVLEMESFTEVLELLKVTSPIEYTYNEKTRTIKIKYIKN